MSDIKLQQYWDWYATHLGAMTVEEYNEKYPESSDFRP